MIYRIASFNLFKLSFESSKDVKKNFDMIAKIITDNKFDLIAMQEVYSPNALEFLISKLPAGKDKWGYSWERPRFLDKAERLFERKKGYSQSKTEAEGYAFVWNKDKFILPKKKNTAGFEKKIEPRIFNQYRLEKGVTPIARNPYYGRFIPVVMGIPLRFEIRLINTHITYGKTGQAKPRQQEFKIIAGQMYKRISKDDPTDSTIYAFMLGDYNLNLIRKFTKPPYLVDPDVSKNDIRRNMEMYHITEEQVKNNGDKFIVEIKTLCTKQESLTTLKMPGKENSDGEGHYANNYDHFTYDTKYDADYIVNRIGRVNAPPLYYGIGAVRNSKNNKNLLGKQENNEERKKGANQQNDQQNDPYARYKKEVSDHLPIYMDIDLTGNY